VPEGAGIKSEKAVENKKVSYTITTKETAASGGKKLTIEKPVEISISPDAEGWANLTVDEKDKSILHLNYWLNPRHEVPKGRKIITYERTSDDKGNYTDGTGVTTTLTDGTLQWLFASAK